MARRNGASGSSQAVHVARIAFKDGIKIGKRRSKIMAKLRETGAQQLHQAQFVRRLQAGAQVDLLEPRKAIDHWKAQGLGMAAFALGFGVAHLFVGVLAALVATAETFLMRPA